MKNLLALLSLLLVVGCAPFVKDGQPISAGSALLIQEGQTAGQTLMARDDGLQAVEIYLRPESAQGGTLKLHLRASPQAESDLALVKMPLQNISAPGWARFEFPVQNNSRQRDYYFWLEVEGKGRLQVDTAPGGAYADGALYQNGSPLDAQMTFRLVYAPRPLFTGIFLTALNWGVILLWSIFLFLAPGWALLSFWPGWDEFFFGEKLGLSAGMSLALYPLLFLLTDLAGLHLGALYAWLPGLAGLGILLWRWVSAWKAKKLPVFALRPFPWNLADLTLLALLALIIFTRFWVIRSLEVPMWGDAYQHTMIAQLLVDNGGLFNSWQPYAELQTFTYHFGFHAAAAVFHWVSGLNLAQSTLWTGQILNVLAVLAVYPLALRLSRNRWAGVTAVLAAGLLSPMPMYYVNWGRYTQLAGQVILPAAITLSWIELQKETFLFKIFATEKTGAFWKNFLLDLKPGSLLWLLWAGLGLTHYRVLIFGIPFFAAFFVFYAQRQNWKQLAIAIVWIGLGAGLLFAPWFLHTFAGGIIRNVSSQLAIPAQSVAVSTRQYNTIGDLSTYLPMLLWLLLPFSLGWGLWRRKKPAAVLGTWWLIVLLAANPQWLGLSGEGALSNFAVFIAAYLLVSALIGFLVTQMLSQSQNHWRHIRRGAQNFLFFLLFLSLAAWGARQRLNDFQPEQHSLAARPDVRAADWIRENTLTEARFLVNSMFAYGGTVIVGTDGGWWLPLLAQRQITVPPLNYGSEQGPDAAYGWWVNTLPQEIQQKGMLNANVMALLRERKVTHVYIGQFQGQVNNGGPQVLVPAELQKSPAFKLVYHQDRVWIFEINYER